MLQHFVKYKLSFSCLESTAKLMNSMPGAKVRLPVTKYRLLQSFQRLSSFHQQYHVYCDRCEIYTTCPTLAKQWHCTKCTSELKLSEKNHIAYIRIEDQLKQILNKYWDEISEFNAHILCGNQQHSDVYSGEVLKNILKTKKHILSLMINTDGVSLKKSSTASFWPLQIICNFLPPGMRFRNENILVAAFYYNNKKPDMKKFFGPFAAEMQVLETDGFIMNDQYFQPVITHAVLDLPAKAAFQNMIQYNGYDACGYCFNHGENTNRGVRYTFTPDAEMRTHESFVIAMQNISQSQSSTENMVQYGIKGISAAIAFEHFDMAKSFGIDYMHCVLIGVTKKMLALWLDSSLKYKWSINNKNQNTLDQRICQIKPCRFISRLPRSLKERKTYKASEYRSLLLYYLPVCLRGILKPKYLNHFNLLSTSIYKLLRTNITDEDLNNIEENLKTNLKRI